MWKGQRSGSTSSGFKKPTTDLDGSLPSVMPSALVRTFRAIPSLPFSAVVELCIFTLVFKRIPALIRIANLLI
jgi:hypothetical protein